MEDSGCLRWTNLYDALFRNSCDDGLPPPDAAAWPGMLSCSGTAAPAESYAGAI